jgi:hypothetical protein
MLLLLLTVSDMHAAIWSSSEAVDEPAVNSAEHGVTTLNSSRNLRSSNTPPSQLPTTAPAVVAGTTQYPVSSITGHLQLLNNAAAAAAAAAAQQARCCQHCSAGTLLLLPSRHAAAAAAAGQQAHCCCCCRPTYTLLLLLLLLTSGTFCLSHWNLYALK